MTTDEEILQNWLNGYPAYSGNKAEDYGWVLSLMSLARQEGAKDEREKIKETGRRLFVNEFKEAYEKGAKDERVAARTQFDTELREQAKKIFADEPRAEGDIEDTEIAVEYLHKLLDWLNAKKKECGVEE